MVKRITLENLVRLDRRAEIGEGRYHVCTTPRCETVYFGTGKGKTFLKPDLAVRFGLKETSPPRPVCYCFHHTVEEIHDEIRRTGHSTVVDRIKADMKGPGCRCEFTNPLGRCCLNSVRAVVAEGFRRVALEETAIASSATEQADCCAIDEHTPRPNTEAPCCPTADRTGVNDPGARGRSPAGLIAATGSVAAAILSSACCWLPLLLVAFGVSAAGVAGFFEAYRPLFIAGALALLGVGFYMLYIRKKPCTPGTACQKPGGGQRVFDRVMFWTASALVATFVFFPDYVGKLFGAPTAVTAPGADARLVATEFRVEGMTCEGCADILRGALRKLPDVAGVEVDYATQAAVVRYHTDRPVPPEQVIEAVRAVGYRAILPQIAPKGEPDTVLEKFRTTNNKRRK